MCCVTSCSVRDGSLFLVLFFFFKQKTAYEVRISDWSSDVCSSDLRLCLRHGPGTADGVGQGRARRVAEAREARLQVLQQSALAAKEVAAAGDVEQQAAAGTVPVAGGTRIGRGPGGVAGDRRSVV